MCICLIEAPILERIRHLDKLDKCVYFLIQKLTRGGSVGDRFTLARTQCVDSFNRHLIPGEAPQARHGVTFTLQTPGSRAYIRTRAAAEGHRIGNRKSNGGMFFLVIHSCPREGH